MKQTPNSEQNADVLTSARHDHNTMLAEVALPDNICKIRDFYGLSRVQMSKLLGFGINVWRDYENGAIPNKSNSSLIYLISYPKNFIRIYENIPLILKTEIGTKKLDIAVRKCEEAIRIFDKTTQKSLNILNYEHF